MPWAAVAGAAVSAIGSYFGARSQQKAQEKQARWGFLSQSYFNDLQRHRQLQDRLYTEKAIGAYRGMGTPGLMTPTYTDPGPEPTDPFAKKSKTVVATPPIPKGPH